MAIDYSKARAMLVTEGRIFELVRTYTYLSSLKENHLFRIKRVKQVDKLAAKVIARAHNLVRKKYPTFKIWIFELHGGTSLSDVQARVNQKYLLWYEERDGEGKE